MPGIRYQLVEEARFALVEPFGMKGVGKPEVLVIKVMAELMQEGAEKGPESDRAPLFCRAHPEGDER